MSSAASIDDVEFSMPRSYPPPLASSSQSASGNRLQHTQSQVNEVVGIMRSNMEMVLERDVKLSDLDTRADALKDGAQQFESTATRIRRKYWWKNLKMWVILIIVILVIIIIIIVWVVLSQDKTSDTKKD